MRIIRIALLVIAVLFVVIQFVRPERNESNKNSQHLSQTLPFPDSVAHILQTACYDCHSNHTEYPWYFKVQPVAWWMNDHIEEAKHDLNFSEFSGYRIFRQFRKLRQIDTTIQTGFMPLDSYTWIHRDAKLSPEQKATIHAWSNALCDSLQRKYPIDSLRKPSH